MVRILQLLRSRQCLILPLLESSLAWESEWVVPMLGHLNVDFILRGICSPSIAEMQVGVEDTTAGPL